MTQEPGPAIPMSERMQSLLSRAVEDQLSEQRQLAVALSDVREQLAQLSHELADLRSQSGPGLPGEAVDALQGAVSGLQQRVAGLADLGDRVDALTARTDRLATRDDVAAMSGGAPSAELSERLEALEAVVAPLAQRLADMTAGDSRYTAGLDELRDRFDTLAERLQAMATGFREQATTDGERLSDLGQRLDVLQEDMTALGSDVAGLVEGSVDRASVQAALDAAEAAARRATEGNDAGVDEQRVLDIVEASVRASEQRLTEHLDDAVLTLAEVLLRRWPSVRSPDTSIPVEPALPDEGPLLDEGSALDEESLLDESPLLGEPARPDEPAEPDEPTWDYIEPEPAPFGGGSEGEGVSNRSADAANNDPAADDVDVDADGSSVGPGSVAPSGTHPPVDLTSAVLGRGDQGHRRRGWFRGKD